MNFPTTQATLDTLPNGLSVILDPDPSAPVVSAQLWVETGSIHEGEQLGAGLSHFLEHMVFKGGGDFGSTELAETVQAAGGHWNAYTTFDRTVYYIDGPDSGLDPFLRVLAAMVFAPHLPEDEFEKEKDVIRREIDMGLDDPGDVTSRQLFSTAFTHDARQHPVIGHRELFDRITYDDLRSYHQTRYTPDHACLCIAGHFDPEKIGETIEQLFAKLPRSMGASPVVPEEPQQLGPRRKRSTFAIPASRVSLAWKAPELGHPDGPALDLAAAMLGSGRSAWLYRRLREEQELALEITAWSWSQPASPGLFAISAEVTPEKRDELIEAIRHELASFSSAALEDDMAKAKRQIIASQLRTLTTISGRASDLASNWHEARNLNFTRDYLAQIEAVTAADIRRALASLESCTETLTILDPQGTPAAGDFRTKLAKRSAPLVHELENGARIALFPDKRVPLIAMQAAVRAGSASETLETAGINRLLAATLPQATKRHSAAELAREFESLGANINASAGNNTLMLQLGGLSHDLPTLLPLFGEVLGEPALESESIERERASMLVSLKESLEDPLSLAFRKLRASIFGDHGFGIPGLGHEASLTSLDRLALSAHHSLHVRGPNLAVALAGDFDPDQAKEIISESFSNLAAGEASHPPASSIQEPTETDLSLDKKQAGLVLGFPGVAANDPRRHALAFLQEWCCDMAGPLFMNIREEHGLAYQVGATQFLGHDTGLFSFYLATDPSQLSFAEEMLHSEIQKLADGGIEAGAFERVRSTILSATALNQQAPSAIARHAAINQLFDLPADHQAQLPEIYTKVTAKEVASAAHDILAQGKPHCVRVRPD